MSALLVPEVERGVIRVFAVTAKPDEMDGAAMAVALGIDWIEMSGVKMLPTADLAGIGLEGYLREGLGVAPEAVLPGTLDGVGETVAIVHSAAFGGRELMLEPRAPLELAAVYRESEGDPGDLMPLESAAVIREGSAGGDEGPGDTRRSAVTLVLVGVVIGLIIGLLLVIASVGS